MQKETLCVVCADNELGEADGVVIEKALESNTRWKYPVRIARQRGRLLRALLRWLSCV